jgi:hypothetical protein
MVAGDPSSSVRQCELPVLHRRLPAMLPGHWTLVGSGPVYGDGADPQMRRPRVRLPGSPGNPRNIVRSLLAKQNLAESGRPQPRPRRGYVPESPLTEPTLIPASG